MTLRTESGQLFRLVEHIGYIVWAHFCSPDAEACKFASHTELKLREFPLKTTTDGTLSAGSRWRTVQRAMTSLERPLARGMGFVVDRSWNVGEFCRRVSGELLIASVRYRSRNRRAASG
jgi:hypothetical protein